MELVGCRVALLTAVLSLAVAATATGLIALVYLALGSRQAGLLEVMISCAIMCMILAPIVLGPLVGLTVRYRDLSARLRDAALTDQLTGIPNRRAFFEHASHHLGHPRSFSLLAIDVDRFKAVNDRLGHEAGDAALTHVARTLGRHLRKAGAAEALLARLGGEEFVVFLDSAEDGIAEALAERLCAGMRATVLEHRGERLPLTVSIGVWSGVAADVDCPLARADAAVYRAKAKGRNRWEVAGQADEPVWPISSSQVRRRRRSPGSGPDKGLADEQG